jgi:hypothetical protein
MHCACCRCNCAPHSTFEADVGSRTTLRVSNEHESSTPRLTHTLLSTPCVHSSHCDVRTTCGAAIVLERNDAEGLPVMINLPIRRADPECTTALLNERLTSYLQSYAHGARDSVGGLHGAGGDVASEGGGSESGSGDSESGSGDSLDAATPPCESLFGSWRAERALQMENAGAHEAAHAVSLSYISPMIAQAVRHEYGLQHMTTGFAAIVTASAMFTRRVAIAGFDGYERGPFYYWSSTDLDACGGGSSRAPPRNVSENARNAFEFHDIWGEMAILKHFESRGILEWLHSPA